MALVAAELGYEGADAYERTRAELLTVSAEAWIAPPRRAPEALEAGTEPEAEVEPEADSEPAPEPEPEVEPEPEPEEEPEPAAEQAPEPAAEQAPEPAAELEPEPERELELEAEPEPELEPEPEAEFEPEPGPDPERDDPGTTGEAATGEAGDPSRRSSRLPLLGLALAAVLVVILFLSRSDEGQPSDVAGPGAAAGESPARPGEEPAPPPAGGDALALEPLPGFSTAGGATVSVTLEDDAPVARVELDGLDRPRGVYALWLFTSLIDSQPLATTASGDGVITAPLPADAASYAFLDLSLERSADDGLHSGRSIMRIPISAVLQPGA